MDNNKSQRTCGRGTLGREVLAKCSTKDQISKQTLTKKVFFKRCQPDNSPLIKVQ